MSWFRTLRSAVASSPSPDQVVSRRRLFAGAAGVAGAVVGATLLADDAHAAPRAGALVDAQGNPLDQQPLYQEGFIGEVKMFAGNFAPRSWAFCHGQLLPISQYSAVFALLGTMYGGDGRTTFALPDLRGRFPIGVGNGPGLSPYREGQKGGTETVTLTTAQMPAHSHSLPHALVRGTGPQVTGVTTGSQVMRAGEPAAAVPPVSTTNEGGNQPQANMPPYLGMNYIICLQGVFPSRS